MSSSAPHEPVAEEQAEARAEKFRLDGIKVKREAAAKALAAEKAFNERAKVAKQEAMAAKVAKDADDLKLASLPQWKRDKLLKKRAAEAAEAAKAEAEANAPAWKKSVRMVHVHVLPVYIVRFAIGSSLSAGARPTVSCSDAGLLIALVTFAKM
jgi:hypothetical protein